MNLFCVGLSHHTANVETREFYARAGEMEAQLRAATGCAEALVLSTCNRVEVYAVAENAIDNQTIVRSLVATELADKADAAAGFYRHEGEDCVQHLFRVASGLDSMVVGETEVLGQGSRPMRRRGGRAARGRICIGFFNARFGWRNRCERTRTLRVARFRWARWRWNWPGKFSGI